MSERTLADSVPDRETFEGFYKHGRDRLLASITRMVRDRDRAEDLTQAAFQTAWEKRAQFRGESSFSTWLYAIGLNAVRQSSRQERPDRRDPVERLEMPRYAEPDRLLAGLEREELRIRLQEALDQIPAKWRRLLVDHYINGHSLQEIARRERVPAGTVGSRLSTATRHLREAWQTPASAGAAVTDRNVRQITDDAIKRLAEELQAGRSEALEQYLAAIGRFHRYSWNNSLLIHAQRPSATHVAGYHTWRDMGRFVKKGEKGIMIYAPLVTKGRRAKETELTKTPGAAQEPARVAGFRTAYVFDVEQTEGTPLPAFARTTGDPKEYGDQLKALVAARGIGLEYDSAIAPADGLSMGGRIKLRPGLAPAEEFSVLVHELAHELLHRGPDRASLSKTVRETQAEAVAFVVSRGIGLETGTAASDYIALYNGDVKTLGESLAKIQEAAHSILKDLLPEPDRADARTDDRSEARRRDPDDEIDRESTASPNRAEPPSLER